MRRGLMLSILEEQMNRRRNMLVAIGAAVAVAPFHALAQTRVQKIPRVGYLQQFDEPFRLDAFKLGLRELGYVEGKTIIVEYRSADGSEARLAEYAAEFVRSNVDVIVSDGGTPSTLAAKKATQTIPIVFPTLADPVVQGVVASLARPGGNLTGLSLQSPDMTGKVLELFKEMLTRAKRIIILVNPANTSSRPILSQVDVAARTLGLEMQTVEVRSPADFADAYAEIARRRADGVVIWNDTMLVRHSATLASLAAKQKLPSMGYHSALPENGGLASYGPNRSDMLRRAAIYVDKILRGAKPGDLPIEQPMKFDFVINLKTAKALGIKIPQAILVRADRVIE
jgi:putative ABC transport system substrate-binding protein